MIEYIFIAIIQGLLEWLPISSSGQVMIITTNLFNITPEQAYSLSIWLHLGTTIAVLVKFRVDFIRIFKSFFQNTFEVKENQIKERNWLIYATIGTGLTAIPLYLIFKIIIEKNYSAYQGDIITLIISGLLIITGVILLKAKKTYGKNTIEEIPKNNIQKDSFIAGLIQGFAVLPGISRSGVTVSTILFEKYDQDNALRLSFLMSVPVAIGSIMIDIIFGEGSIFGVLSPFEIILITFVSFIIGYLSMELLLRIAQKISFGYFCILYGIIAYVIILPFILMP